MRRRGGRDAGETLLELIVSIAILGTCVVAVASGIALSVKVSDIHRKQATVSAYARSYAEAIENTVAISAWAGCAATPATYQSPAGFSLPSYTVYSAAVSSVKYWNGSAFFPSCASDTGLQQLTLSVASTDARVSETVVVVIRKPCVTSC